MIRGLVIGLLTLLSIGNAEATCIELRENSEVTVSTATRV